MGKFIKDISSTPPAAGGVVVLRTVDDQGPLEHDQFDQNLWLIAQEALANYSARQGAFVGSDQIQAGAVASSAIADEAIQANHIAPGLVNAVVPAGTIFPFGGELFGYPTLYKDSFLLCDGATISRESPFDALFAAIGTVWGVGDE